ncbi:MAG: hypothetical protein ABIQ11_03085, partial [Saprospiraceae bacterium]
MADFIQHRQSYNKINADYESARLSVFSTNEKIKYLEQQIKNIKGKQHENNEANRNKLIQLEKQIEDLRHGIEEKENELKSVAADLKGIIGMYAEFTDPRLQINKHFKNETPFLLFPVRMETRFKNITDPLSGRTKNQLWVRIYPDTCMVDTFDPQLSPQEIRNGARFWAEYYAAGEIADSVNPDPQTVDKQKAAWKFLSGIEGPGRAAWIVQSNEAKPQPSSILPVRDSDKTLILTIATEDATILNDQNVIFTFFKDLWLAGKNAEKISQIKAATPNADEYVEKFLPVNFNDPLPPGLKREDAQLKVALIILPPEIDGTGKTNAWSQPARVTTLPERFVLLGYKDQKLVIEEFGNFIPNPLPVGFDPNDTSGNYFKPTDEGDLNIPDNLKWIIDFDAAVDNGMGFRIDLKETTINGVDRLFAIGINLRADETKGGGEKMLGELFDHHYYSSKGLSIIAQGTPTNNTESETAGSAGTDDTDITFERYFQSTSAYVVTDDWQQKKDGQWLGEWLGLDEKYFQKAINGDRTDQADALNMNLALWPGTLGYAMEAMMNPVFGKDTAAQTHQFFSMFISGRGALPAIRIGNQPYGILASTPFHRLKWMFREDSPEANERISFPFRFGGMISLQGLYLQELYQLLLKMEADWKKLFVNKVAHVSAENAVDIHQEMLDILGLHPSSVEYYYRHLDSLEMLSSLSSFSMPFDQKQAAFKKMDLEKSYEPIVSLGYKGTTSDLIQNGPLLNAMIGHDDSIPCNVIIDTVPLSETKAIRSYTADNKNYITALIRAAKKSIDALRTNDGLDKKPTALLFAILKFALEQGYYETAVKLHENAGIFDPIQAHALKAEKPFMHMNWDNKMVESKYSLLYKNESLISQINKVGDHIAELAGNRAALYLISPGLAQQMDALHDLEDASTARLERAFVEHLDCCSYRLDAWQQGLIKFQLMQMRRNQPRPAEGSAPDVKQGIYLGAFGWLENVKPDKGKLLKPKTLTEELAEDFKSIYVTDEANAGYIHAPSVNQAVTSAVLRNAFLTHGKTNNNQSFAVNLSSERIRLALSVIEGIQNGQSLAALLGYKFERMLHDHVNLKDLGIDTYIYAVRKQFPLNANKIVETQVQNDPSVDPDTVPVTAIEARNVIHGKNLIDHIRKQTGQNKLYPFGFGTAKLPSASAIISGAINEAVGFIMNIEDAIADLGMAESVHQVCLGNYDRAAGVLESFSNGNYPQIPDVIQTPRSGITLTHRIGVHIDFITAALFDPAHPRKSVEPSLDSWLAQMLPAMSDILCRYKYTDRTDDSVKTGFVSMQDLALTASDLFYMVTTTGETAMTDLDDEISQFIFDTKTPRLDTDIMIEYIERTLQAGKFSLFEMISLIRSLRTLILEGRSLKPHDIILPGEASKQDVLTATHNAAIVEDAKDELQSFLGNYNTQIITPLSNLPGSVISDLTNIERETVLSNVDTLIQDLSIELKKLRRFGIPQTGIGHLFTRRQELINLLKFKITTLIDRFITKQEDYDLLEADYDPLDPEVIAHLQKMEATVSTV